MVHTVTGVTGLLGAHLVAHLLDQDHQVRAIYRNAGKLALLQRTLRYYWPEEEAWRQRWEAIDFREADLLDLPALEEALPGTDYLYHCAARVSFAARDREALLHDNKTMTAQVVDLARELGVQKLVYISSVAALGRKRGQKHFNEDNHWVESSRNSFYARSKYRAELEAWRGNQEGLPTIILNPSIILGPGFWEQGSGAFFRQIQEGFPFYSQGVNGVVDVRDVAQVAREMALSAHDGERYVLAGANVSYQELFTTIADALEVKRPRIAVKPWMSALVWRWEALAQLWPGREARVTRETAATAMQEYYYHSLKLDAALPQFEFRDWRDTVAYTAACYREDQSAPLASSSVES